MQRTSGRGLIALLVPICVSLVALEVRAYCRTTTCDNGDVTRSEEAEAACARRDERGCSLSGHPLSWHRRCVSYSVEAEGSPARGISYEDAVVIIGEAMSAWVEVDCMPGSPAIEIVQYAAYQCAAPGFSKTGRNSNAWIFRDDDWPEDEAHTPSTLALTTVTNHPDTGEIVDVDVEINSEYFTLSEADNSELAAIALHEAGHFYGLADLYSSLDHGATMYGYYQPSLEFAEGLTRDDRAGICAIYPPGSRESSECASDPVRGFSPDCPSERDAASCQCTAGRSSSPLAGLGCLVGLLVLLRRRRPRSGLGWRVCHGRTQVVQTG